MRIDCIQVPGPEQVGDANIYLLQVSDRKVLVDTGPGREETFQALKSGVKDLGVEIEDIDLILLTHPHSDHFGNASRIKEIADAEVAMHREAKKIVEDYPAYVEDWNNRFESYFERNGVPEEENNDLLKEAIPDAEGVSVDIDRELEEGDEIAGLEVVYTPGHTPGSVTFLVDDLALVGDTVLADITPNPMLYLDENGEAGPSLQQYILSLEKLRAKNVEALLPGHGDRIDDPRGRIGEILEHHEGRKEEVLEIVEHERTAFEVMEEMFPGLPTEKYLFGMSEAVGHLELLVSEGKIERVEEGERVKYRRVQSS